MYFYNVIHVYDMHMYYMCETCITGALHIYYKCMKYMCNTPKKTHVTHVRHMWILTGKKLSVFSTHKRSGYCKKAAAPLNA